MKKEMLQMIEKMESNKFLLPDSWSDDIELGLNTYKTYVGGRGYGRYLNIEISGNGDKILTMTFRGEKLYLDHEVSLKKPVITAYNLLKEIYEQKFSFKTYSEEKQKLAREIIELRNTIKTNKTKLDEMVSRYEASKELETN